ncbi:MAG: hypothetical protein WCS85_03500 [Candidatus Peribacteraceae bacterium]|jgi:hypothetical protein
MSLDLYCRPMSGGAVASVYQLIQACMTSLPRGFHVYYTKLMTVPQQWIEDAAYFRWLNAKMPQRDYWGRKAEYDAAERALRERPLGAAITYEDDHAVIILHFVMLPSLHCSEMQSVINNLLHTITENNKRKLLICNCDTEAAVRCALEDCGFHKAQRSVWERNPK